MINVVIFQSHTCGVFVPLNNASYIFVIGGWDANLDYVNVVEVIIIRTQIGTVFVIVFRIETEFRSSPL